jgi:hypothetical protein
VPAVTLGILQTTKGLVVQIDLQTDELKITAGSVSYQLPGGKKFTGLLIITNKRLLYDVPFDLDAKGRLPEVMFIKWSSVGYMGIDRTDIKHTEVIKGLLSTKLILVLKDGSKHIFNSGLLGKDFSKAITISN